MSNVTPETVSVSLLRFLGYFLRLGATGFGGPIALAGYMQRDLVEDRRWVSREEYVEGLAFAQLSPGPLAAQLAMYLGWIRAGLVGATLVAVAFVLPSFLMVLALAALYVWYEELPWMQGVFYGIGAAVIAIIVRSVFKLARIAVGTDWLRLSIAGVCAVVTAWTESEIVWVFLLGGLITLFLRAPPRLSRWPPLMVLPSGLDWLVTGLHQPAAGETLWTILWYFAEAGTFVFGSGLAIIPFLHHGSVEHYGWLSERQFLDAVAVAMITPGPVIITAAFIGFLAAGPVGSTLAALGVFFPCYAFVVVLAPFYRRFAKNPQVKAFVQGVTAAATGAIAGAAVVLGRHAIRDWPTALIFVVTYAVLYRFRKVPEPLVIVTAGLVGLALRQG